MERELGAAAHGEPMNLQVNGILIDEPYRLRIEANFTAVLPTSARCRSGPTKASWRHYRAVDRQINPLSP